MAIGVCGFSSVAEEMCLQFAALHPKRKMKTLFCGC